MVSQENDQNVTINCTVQGHPIRKVSWLRNGQPIQSSARIRPYVDRLLFKQVKREDVSVGFSKDSFEKILESTLESLLSLPDSFRWSRIDQLLFLNSQMAKTIDSNG